MQRIFVCLLAALLAATALPSVDAERTEQAPYLPGLIIVRIACSGEQHAWLPDHTPGVDELVDDPVGWALSGEPECAPNDLRNMAQGTNEPGGYGAAAFVVFGGETNAAVTTYDEVFGPHDSWLSIRTPESQSTGESEESEGCGPQFVMFPPDMFPPFGDPYGYVLLWAFINEVAVTEDLSRVCFASAGHVEAKIG